MPDWALIKDKNNPFQNSQIDFSVIFGNRNSSELVGNEPLVLFDDFQHLESSIT